MGLDGQDKRGWWLAAGSRQHTQRSTLSTTQSSETTRLATLPGYQACHPPYQSASLPPRSHRSRQYI
ncbi:hypothetical protein E2C01_022478 [Portunus trituberculatus]|uniref:Uncharacterized protein n=1 Tax=Portunus trituberculatus TaxID=210409 RepID=A0A5B7E908_PORTR|nr:hypothetical protein [Portunus trituberculatus]